MSNKLTLATQYANGSYFAAKVIAQAKKYLNVFSKTES